MEKRVVHEVRLSKPLMAVAIVASVGLLAIGLKPVLDVSPAFASSVQKVVICDTSGYTCADVSSIWGLQVRAD